MLEPLGVLGFVTATIASIIGGLAALGVVFGFGIIAAQLLLTNVESYIVVGGGVLLLGFAGSRWTTDIASRYLSYAVAIGIKLFSLYLIIGIGNSLAGQWGVLARVSGRNAESEDLLPDPRRRARVHDARLVHPVARVVALLRNRSALARRARVHGREASEHGPRQPARAQSQVALPRWRVAGP